jgi:hypothetical protein
MFEEKAGQAQLPSEQGSGSRSGCGSAHQTPVTLDNTPASEQAFRDESERARNKRVRAHRNAPKAEAPPPFSDHSGQL